MQKHKKYINIKNNRICQIADITPNPNFVVIYYIDSGNWGLQGCISQPELETVIKSNLVEI